MRKRILSIVFILALCLSSFPVQAFAADEIDTVTIMGVSVPTDIADRHPGSSLSLSGSCIGTQCTLTREIFKEGESFLSQSGITKASEAGDFELVLTLTPVDPESSFVDDLSAMDCTVYDNNGTDLTQGTDYTVELTDAKTLVIRVPFTIVPHDPTDDAHPCSCFDDSEPNYATHHHYTCATCGREVSVEHTFSYTSVDDDTHTKSCAICGFSIQEAHRYDNGVVTIPATYTAPGERMFTCADCDHTKTEAIAQLHSGGGGGGNNSGIGSGGTYSWGERAILNKVGIEFYELLEDNDQPGQMLTDGDTWTLAETDPVPPVQYEINDVYVLQEDEPTYWADETQPAAQPDPLSNPAYYLVDTQNGDKSLNFKGLKGGDLVRTTTFNGIYITNVTRTGNANYETDIARTKSNIFASYRAFEMDHPEIFWLNGSLKLRILTPTINGKQISYLFLTTADAAGFTMLISNYAAPNAIAEGIARRNTAVETIYATLPKTDTRATIAAINRWLTMHNEYNRTQDLLTIGLIPHQVLCALMGNEGVNGPVCDSYSKAFKMLCDRCKIPCVLVTGTAYANNHSEYHMWNQVQLNGSWYGVDCAWNDPVVRGIYGAVSGYENEKFLLVGASTIIDGMRFDASHVADATPAGVAGIVFSSLDVDLESDYAVPFDDVSIVNWYYEYVRDVLYKGLMSGTAENAFSPKMTATRGQIVQILYNVAGQPTVKEVKVEGWYGKAATWALEKGIVAGYDDGGFHGDDPVTREQLATMLYVFAGSPKTSGTLTYADADQVSEYAVNALLWAKKLGVISGKPGNLVDPHGLATRAEIAAIFSAFTAE